MPKFFIKAQDLEEYDSVKIFNQRGKEIYWTKEDFIATGHRIKIYLADTITECGYVQEKVSRNDTYFEFAARDKFGTVERDQMSRLQRYVIDYDEDLELEGDGATWRYVLYRGALPMMTVRNEQYLIPGQALNMCETYILDVDIDSDALICISFALAVYALNKYGDFY